MNVKKNYRPNIFIKRYPNVVSVDDDDHLCKLFEKQLTDVKNNKRHAAKVIIYVQSIHTATKVFAFLNSGLDDAAIEYGLDGHIQLGAYVDMYTKLISKANKKLIVKDFLKPDDRIRILASTVAFSTGLDVPNVRQVFIVGTPKCQLQRSQEIGTISILLLIRNNSDLM